jgi:hypothetical protein
MIQLSSNVVLSLGSIEVVAIVHATQPPALCLASCGSMVSCRAESGYIVLEPLAIGQLIGQMQSFPQARSQDCITFSRVCTAAEAGYRQPQQATLHIAAPPTSTCFTTPADAKRQRPQQSVNAFERHIRHTRHTTSCLNSPSSRLSVI